MQISAFKNVIYCTYITFTTEKSYFKMYSGKENLKAFLLKRKNSFQNLCICVEV